MTKMKWLRKYGIMRHEMKKFSPSSCENAQRFAQDLEPLQDPAQRRCLPQNDEKEKKYRSKSH